MASAGVALAHAFPEEITFAAEALRKGEVVAYPTETSYGLGVNALDELALVRLRQLKGRDGDKPISVLVSGTRDAGPTVSKTLPPLARRLMAAYWPGPLTLVLPAHRDLPRAAGVRRLRRRARVVASHGAGPGRGFRGSGDGDQREPGGRIAGDDPRDGRGNLRGALPGDSWRRHPGGAPSTVARVRGGRLEILRQGVLRIEVD